MKSYDRLIAWLTDAYAMEQTRAQVLVCRVTDTLRLPALQHLEERHLAETRRHAALVAGCVARLGGTPSGITSARGMAAGTVQPPLTALATDTLVKHCLADYATEQFEVIAYQALIEAAAQLGETETVLVCLGILAEDQAMADALVHHLPSVIAVQVPACAAATRALLVPAPSVTHEA